MKVISHQIIIIYLWRFLLLNFLVLIFIYHSNDFQRKLPFTFLFIYTFNINYKLHINYIYYTYYIKLIINIIITYISYYYYYYLLIIIIIITYYLWCKITRYHVNTKKYNFYYYTFIIIRHIFLFFKI